MMDSHSSPLGTAHRRLEQIMVLERALRHDARDVLPNACVAVGTAAYAGTLYPLIAIIAGTTVMQPHAGPLLPFSSFALLVALVLGCWGPTWTAPGERRGGEAAAPLLAGAD